MPNSLVPARQPLPRPRPATTCGWMGATTTIRGDTMQVSDLIDIEAIKRVKYRYLRCIDQKLWDDLAEVLTEDCTAAYSGGKYSYEGRDAIIEFLRTSMGSEDFLSSH